MMRRRGRALVGAIAVATLILAACSSKGDGSGGTSKFADKIQQNSRAAASDINILLREINDASGSYDELTQIASDSDELHGHLHDFYQQILTTADLGNSLQSDLVSDEETLMHAVGAIHKWTGDPNPSNNASWQDQMGQGIVGWNSDIRKLWKSAGLTNPPTIKVPS